MSKLHVGLFFCIFAFDYIADTIIYKYAIHLPLKDKKYWHEFNESNHLKLIGSIHITSY